MAELGARLSEVVLQAVCEKRWAPSSGTSDGWRTEPRAGGPAHPPAWVRDALRLGTFAGAQVEQDESGSERLFSKAEINETTCLSPAHYSNMFRKENGVAVCGHVNTKPLQMRGVFSCQYATAVSVVTNLNSQRKKKCLFSNSNE